MGHNLWLHFDVHQGYRVLTRSHIISMLLQIFEKGRPMFQACVKPARVALKEEEAAKKKAAEEDRSKAAAWVFLVGARAKM